MNNIAIKVENISKLYHIGKSTSKSLRDSVSNTILNLKERKKNAEDSSEFWALKNVSFDIEKGDIVGVIGKNGAGKSTLLKILSRITEPTTGKITINGRIGSLLEVGTGFHPELTGRENIYLNGSILGMKRSEIQSKFDEIVDFSGIEKFIDTPVKRYSSGMYVRLAFSVAAHLEPEVMIVDEVLAVGDIDFQKKCLGKLGDVASHGRTIFLVSHNMGSISTLCKNGIYLKNGSIESTGHIEKVIGNYLSDVAPMNHLNIAERTDRTGSGEVKITELGFYTDETNDPVSSILAGTKAKLKIAYELKDSRLIGQNIVFGVRFFNRDGQFVTALNNIMANSPIKVLKSNGTVYCTILKMPLMAGKFYTEISCVIDNRLCDDVNKALEFEIIEADFYGSGMINSFGRQGVYIEQKWEA